MSKISIVVPSFNEEDNVGNLVKQIGDSLSGIDYEIVFVDDSTDGTPSKLQEIMKRDDRVRMKHRTGEKGLATAVICGFRMARGDYLAVMDADLQHPPETILQMYAYWKEGYEVVEGVKVSRGKESKIHKWLAGAFYDAISGIMHVDMRNSSDFKLLDRKAAEAVCSLTEKNTFFRALTYWVGFKSIAVSYEVQERVAGTTKWSYWKLGKYALRNLISFSNAPLQIVTVIGILFLLVGAVWGVDAVVSFFQGRSVGGYPSLVLLIIIATGGIMVSLGIIGAYIAKIYDEIKNRPQYIIREKKD